MQHATAIQPYIEIVIIIHVRFEKEERVGRMAWQHNMYDGVFIVPLLLVYVYCVVCKCV